MTDDTNLLPELYAEIAALTRPLCGGAGCGHRSTLLHRCCERLYCDLARQHAREKWGVELRETGHPTLPFMGEGGCTVAPHLRPLCSMHACGINWGGGKGADAATLTHYATLRARIDAAAKLCNKTPTLPKGNQHPTMSLLDQYLVEVNDFKSSPRFTLYKVPNGSPVDTSTFAQITSGSAISVQEVEPNGASTFTLSVSEP